MKPTYYSGGKLVDKGELKSIEDEGLFLHNFVGGSGTADYGSLRDQESAGGSGGFFSNDGNDDDGSSRFQKVKSRAKNLSKNKWLVGGVAGCSGLLVILVIALIILAGVYKVVDFAEHVASWQFARVTSQMAENTNNITEEEIAVNSIKDDSLYAAIKDKYDTATGQVGELWSNMQDKYSPNKIISNFEEKNVLSFNQDTTKLGRSYIKSVTINGQDVPLEDASLSNSLKNKLIPGYSFKNQIEFSRDFVPELDKALNVGEVAPLIRGLVASKIRQELGVGFVAWNIGKFTGKTQSQANGEVEDEETAASEGEQLSLFDGGQYEGQAPTTATGASGAIDSGAQQVESQMNSDLSNPSELAKIVANPNVTPANVASTLESAASSTSIVGAQGVAGGILGAVNPVYKIGVPLCLIYDGSIVQSGPTIDEQSDQLERSALWVQSAAAQEKDGSNVSAEAVGATDWKLGDITQSNAEKRASGIDVNTSDTLSTEASPTGQYTYSIADYIPVIGSVADDLTPSICSAVTNLYLGIGLGIGNIALTFFTGPEDTIAGDAGEAAVNEQLSLFDASTESTEAASQSPSLLSSIISKASKAGSLAKNFVKQTTKQFVAIGSLTLLAKQLVVAEMGGSHSTIATGQSFDDSVDDGTNLYANQIEQQQFYGAPMTDSQLGPDKTANQATLAAEESHQSMFSRYASLSNPDSLLSNVAMDVDGYANGSFFGLLKHMGLSLLNPLKGIGSLFGGLTSKEASAATPTTSANTYYGNVQFGYTQYEKSLMDSCPANSHDTVLCSYQPLENQLILDQSGNEAEIAAAYGKCFTSSIGTLLSNGWIVRNNSGDVIANQGDCSPDMLGPDSSSPLAVDTNSNSPNQNDMIFRWRVAMNYNNTLDQLNDEQAVSSSPSLNECASEEETNPTTSNQSFYTTIGKNICDKNGNTFVPYGISVVDDLEGPNWCSPQKEAATDAQIQAAANYWHINSIRIQVSEDHFISGNNCVNNGQTYTPQDALARLGTEVNEIEEAGKVPIINDDAEQTGDSKAPTQTTINFWNQVTAYLASQNGSGEYDNVIFDIFNEPVTTGSTWSNGGVYEGTTYLGMQQVVNAIRNGSNLNNNLIFVEGQGQQGYTHSASLNVLDNYQLTGSNLVYDYHHVNLDHPESDWKDTMGLNSSINAPIVDGEWTQYDSSRSFECYINAPANISAYFKLMQQNNIGMIFWSLEPGVGTVNGSSAYPVSDTIQNWFPTNPSGYSQPTTFAGAYKCAEDSSGNLLGLGAGTDVMNYFEKYSGY